jgi:hypothetical protein
VLVFDVGHPHADLFEDLTGDAIFQRLARFQEPGEH